MKLLVDENIPSPTVKALRDIGHDVLDIRGTKEEGMKDASLWRLAQQERRLLITTDKGFTTYRNDPHYGIIVVRLKQPNRRKIHQRVIQAITEVKEAEWPGLLTVMRDYAQSTWRVRPPE